jgi:hypothetical protein
MAVVVTNYIPIIGWHNILRHVIDTIQPVKKLILERFATFYRILKFCSVLAMLLAVTFSRISVQKMFNQYWLLATTFVPVIPALIILLTLSVLQE